MPSQPHHIAGVDGSQALLAREDMESVRWLREMTGFQPGVELAFPPARVIDCEHPDCDRVLLGLRTSWVVRGGKLMCCEHKRAHDLNLATTSWRKHTYTGRKLQALAR